MITTPSALAAGYAGLLFFLGADGLRRGYGFWRLFGRFMLFLYGYKLFDILVLDQYIVITRKYFVQFYPETKNCKSWDDRSFNTKKPDDPADRVPVCVRVDGVDHADYQGVNG